MCIRDSDYLKQCVFDNGIRQTCGDIRNLCALLLCLLHAGIHKYRTSGDVYTRQLVTDAGLTGISDPGADLVKL